MVRCKFIAMIVMGMLLVLPKGSVVAEPPTKDDVAKKYRALVEQLASPNKKAVTNFNRGPSVTFPAGYDVAAQEPINVARKTLHDDIAQSLPYLFEALEDERYCMTVAWGESDGYYNRSVGQTCRDIIASQLEVYREEIASSDPGHWHRYDYPVSKKWWQARKDRTLPKLQIEAIDWAIKVRKAEPANEVREDRKDEIEKLQKLRDQIAKSGKPAKANGMLRMITKNKRAL